MAANIQCTKAALPETEIRLPKLYRPPRSQTSCIYFGNNKCNHNYSRKLRVSAVDRKGVGDGGANNNIKKQGGGGGGGSAPSSPSAVPSSNYVVPLDKASSITRPLGEILRDLNRKIPDNIIKIRNHGSDSTLIPWYHANRMLSFYAPGWWGEIRDIIFSDNGSVTVVYRVTIRGSDNEAYRESTGTVSSADGHIVDPVGAAEEIAFCRACARFGLGLYLYHDE